MGSLAQGLLGFNASRHAAKAQRAAADAQMAAAERAAEESRFRPIGVTNAFGSSNFTTDSEGRVTGAGYTINPQLAAIRDQLLGLAGNTNVAGANDAIQQAQQGLFSSVAGSGDIMGATQRLFNQRQNLMAPQRERDFANLRNNVFQAGRSGLAVGGTNAGGFAAANPEMQAYFNAQRQQDDALLAQSEQDARRYRQDDLSTFGGLFNLQGQSMSPLLSLLQGAQGVEGIGRSAYEDSLRLGQLNQNTAGANALLSGGMAAADSRLAAANTANAGRTAIGQGILDSATRLFTGGFSNPFAGMSGFMGIGTTGSQPKPFGGGDYSDIRLKKNIVKIGERPDGLNIYEFEYVWGGGKKVGLMAQEVMKVVPSAVSQDADGFYMVDYSKV